MKTKLIYFFVLVFFFLYSCANKPKIIEESIDNSPTLSTPETINSLPVEAHEVLVDEIMNTKKYTYVSGREGGEAICVAIPLNMDIQIGKKYYYMGGLRMNTFEKMNFKQDYQTIILVGGLSETPVSDQSAAMSDPGSPQSSGQVELHPEKVGKVPGGVTIAELVNNKSKFNGQKIMVKGQCVKVNRNIMGKNWIHIQDGSKDEAGEFMDLTITTQDLFNIGDIVILEGVIALNKDFGAGYKYDYIMEEAVAKH